MLVTHDCRHSRQQPGDRRKRSSAAVEPAQRPAAHDHWQAHRGECLLGLEFGGTADVAYAPDLISNSGDACRVLVVQNEYTLIVTLKAASAIVSDVKLKVRGAEFVAVRGQVHTER